MRGLDVSEFAAIVCGSIIAVIVVPTGSYLASTIAEKQPVLALLTMIISIVLPLVATARVTFRIGYDSGKNAALDKQSANMPTKGSTQQDAANNFAE